MKVYFKWAIVNGVRLHDACRDTSRHPLLLMIKLIPGALGIAEKQYRPQLDHFGREGSGFQVVSFYPRAYGESHDVERPDRDSFNTDALDGQDMS